MNVLAGQRSASETAAGESSSVAPPLSSFMMTMTQPHYPHHRHHQQDVYAVFAWGRNEDGQLGTGDTNDQDEPIYVDSLRGVGVRQISCGSGHTVVLTQENKGESGKKP